MHSPLRQDIGSTESEVDLAEIERLEEHASALRKVLARKFSSYFNLCYYIILVSKFGHLFELCLSICKPWLPASFISS
jgi:hypothetical protein